MIYEKSRSNKGRDYFFVTIYKKTIKKNIIRLKKNTFKLKYLVREITKEAIIMKLVPLGDRVVLKQLVAEETTKSGIVLPGQNKEKPQQAEVIAVGPGGVIDGKEVKMEVKVGDNVIYSKYAGTDVKLDDEEYIVVKQADILAIIE